MPFTKTLLIGLLILLSGSIGLHAATRILRVIPDQTDATVETVHGPHIAVYDTQSVSRHLLFLFFVGTGVNADNSLNIDSVFAKWGYHAISLDYENNVLAASFTHSPDNSTFGHYREAIVTGAPVSEKIQVSPANSILNRLQKLLIYLAKNDPTGSWGEFVHKGQPDWSRIIVAGHSQGSGHAAYIGKLFRVNRVLMFSGPQDYMDDFDRPAPWQARKSATPPSRFFAFLNLKDPFNVHHQIANCMALMEMSQPDTLIVKPGQVIEGDHHILINDFPTKYHGSTLLPQYENVWKYMATAAIR